MCITAKEPNMYDLMRKLPIGIQTFEDIRRKIIYMWIKRHWHGEWRIWESHIS